MNEINVRELKDIDFDTIPKNHISLGWQLIRGYYLIVWKKEVGNSNNNIKYYISIPESFNWAIINYVSHFN